MSIKTSVSGTRSATEQLRSDHIENLELLQQFQDENKRLKAEIKLLKSANINKVIVKEDAVSESPENEIDYLSLVETNTKQQDEIKMLKLRVNQAEIEIMKQKQQAYSIQQVAVQSNIEKTKKREVELTQAVVELESELASSRTKLMELQFVKLHCEELEEQYAFSQAQYEASTVECQSLRNTNHDLIAQLQDLRLDMKNFEVSMTGKATQDRRQLEQMVDSHTAEFKRQLQQLADQNASLRGEVSAGVEATYRLQVAAQLLEGDKARLQAQVVDLEDRLRTNLYAATATAAAVAQAGAMDFSDSDSERSGRRKGAGIAVPEGSLFSLTAPAAAAVSVGAGAGAVPVEGVDSSQDSSFRFQEFMRLKRENKELKMRLAEGAGAAVGGSGSGSGVMGGGGSLYSSASSGAMVPSSGGGGGGVASGFSSKQGSRMVSSSSSGARPGGGGGGGGGGSSSNNSAGGSPLSLSPLRVASNLNHLQQQQQQQQQQSLTSNSHPSSARSPKHSTGAGASQPVSAVSSVSGGGSGVIIPGNLSTRMRNTVSQKNKF
jgi:hypothetical protein